MHRARLTSEGYQTMRATLTFGYRPGPLPAGYIVFRGKQGKASHHYSTRDVTQAEQRVDGALRAAQRVATRRAEERRKTKQPKADVTVTTSSVAPAQPRPEALINGQGTAAEHEVVERHWLSDPGEWAAPALPWLRN